LEGKYKLLAPKWAFFYRHACCKKADKNTEIDMKKGDWYYSKVCMLRTKNCLLPIAMKVLLPKLGGMTRKKVRKVV
jgi:hypothetical protein